MRYLNQWYIFRLGHTKSGKKFFRFHFEKGIEMGQSPKVDMTEGSIYQKVKYPYCEN